MIRRRRVEWVCLRQIDWNLSVWTWYYLYRHFAFALVFEEWVKNIIKMADCIIHPINTFLYLSIFWENFWLVLDVISFRFNNIYWCRLENWDSDNWRKRFVIGSEATCLRPNFLNFAFHNTKKLLSAFFLTLGLFYLSTLNFEYFRRLNLIFHVCRICLRNCNRSLTRFCLQILFFYPFV